MKNLLLFSVLWFSAVSFAQDMERDTIHLKEVKVYKSTKKAKVKKIEFGDKSTRHGNFSLYFDSTQPGYYLVDNISYGTLQEITLFFSFIGRSVGSKNFVSPDLIDETKFQLTIFECTTEGNVGKKINPEPITVLVTKSSKWRRGVTIDLSAYNFVTDSFFINLKNVTDTSCYECYYYAPSNFKSERPLLFHAESNEEAGGDKIVLQRKGWGAGLLMDIKTLTGEY